jgi:hypothetical protein
MFPSSFRARDSQEPYELDLFRQHGFQVRTWRSMSLYVGGGQAEFLGCYPLFLHYYEPARYQHSIIAFVLPIPLICTAHAIHAPYLHSQQQQVTLGPRVLRTEAAVPALVALAHDRLHALEEEWGHEAGQAETSSMASSAAAIGDCGTALKQP